MAGLDPEALSSSGMLPGDSEEARDRRRDMVESQLERRGIRSTAVLSAFRTIPRHQFCSLGTSLRAAYGDHPLGIGHGQTISQPFMVAEMTQMLALSPSDRVLEVGTGSGYQAAILALLVAEAVSVERIAPLAEQARSRFAALGLSNVHVHLADGTLGWPERAPYDAIIVTAASPTLPEPLQEQLSVGGRLAIPVGSRHFQELVICERTADGFSTRKTTPCRFVPLIGRHGWDE